MIISSDTFEAPILSICIPVYNQKSILRDCIAEVLKYEGNDIEVVINDNSSEDNLEELVNEFNDSRLQYFRNNTNIGHDLNIIQSFKNSRAKYAFLLRTKDRLFSYAIPKIIERIIKNPNLSYITGNAIDENNNLIFSYDKEIHSQGENALKAHMNLYIHPSGSLYAIHRLDLDRAELFIKEKFNDNIGFLVHNMFRLELAFKGDFEIITSDVWQYTNTLRSTQKSVQIIGNKESPYSPRLQLRRFKAEAEWTHKIVIETKVLDVLKWLSSHYLRYSTWHFVSINNNLMVHRHYGSNQIEFSLSDVRRDFLGITDSIAEEYINDKFKRGIYKKYIKKILIVNRFYLVFIVSRIYHRLKTNINSIL